jgi:hypothetical protein
MIYIGIDPGVDGAMAIIYSDDEVEVYPYDNSNTLSVLNELLDAGEDAIAVIEKQWLRKGDKTPVGKLIQNYGEWIGRLEINGVETHHVAARTWKAEMSVTSKKQSSLVAARLLFPNMKNELQLVKDHNKAEALLIAAYAKNIF